MHLRERLPTRQKDDGVRQVALLENSCAVNGEFTTVDEHMYHTKQR